jgi:hypothetical protein
MVQEAIMATQFIELRTSDADARLVGDLLNAVRLLDQLYAQLEKMANKMERMVDGEDHSQIEKLFGMPVNTGAPLKTIIDDLLADLGTGDAEQLRSRLG